MVNPLSKEESELYSLKMAQDAFYSVCMSELNKDC